MKESKAKRVQRKADPDFPKLEFSRQWRPYQSRILDALSLHNVDKKIHIIAPPGAGKTTLGIEIYRRLGRACIIFSPTRIIRDQWMNRLSDFTNNAKIKNLDWVSSDLSDIKPFTSITYQALHAKFRNDNKQDDLLDDELDQDEENETNFEDQAPSASELDGIVAEIKASKVGLLIFDEAHHLRQEWWKALKYLVEQLEDVLILGLTATPPFDVNGQEWKKYEELCGPIDEEIAVPELIRANTLCPHQDYVWLVHPSSSEISLLKNYESSVEQFLNELLRSDAVKQFVTDHSWLSSEIPADLEIIYDKPDVFVSILVLRKALGLSIPKKALKILDCSEEELPALTRKRWQAFLEHFLFEKDTKDKSPEQKAIEKSLRDQGLLWRRELRIQDSRPMKRTLSLSTQKMKASLDIFELERKIRGTELRQVILLDYIADSKPMNPQQERLGVWPLFKMFVNSVSEEDRSHIGVISGRICILSKKIAKGLDKNEITTEEIEGFQNFVSVKWGGTTQKLVPMVTDLLTKGEIRVLIGTRSLLGEGWDCPGVNSLLLLSNVGSMMTTNQMRGRAIRVNPSDPNKIASIWHVAAIETSVPIGHSDYESLYQRFTTFAGLSNSSLSVESGLARIALPAIKESIDLMKSNEEMANKFTKLHDVGERWKVVVQISGATGMAPVAKAKVERSYRRLQFQNTLKRLLITIGTTFLFIWGQTMRGANNQSSGQMLTLMVFGAGIAFIITLPGLIRALIIFVRHLPVDGSMKQIAWTVLDTMIRLGLIEAQPSRIRLKIDQAADGQFEVALLGVPFRESSLFIDNLTDVLGAIENPRYLIERREMARLLGKIDYHVVPEQFAIKKERAEIFAQSWRQRMGPSDLIYTRTEEGRKLLLKARARAFSTAFQNSASRFDRWQ